MDISIIIEKNPWRRDREAIKSDDKVKEALLKNLMPVDFCYQIDTAKKQPIFRKEKKEYFTVPFIARTIEKKVLGKDVMDAPKMAETIVFDSLKTVHNDVYVINSGEEETDFYAEGKNIEVKWSDRPKARRDTVVLSKKEYNPKDLIFPLPVFLLWHLKNGRRKNANGRQTRTG